MEGVLTGKRVSRLDSISIDGTYFTPEGYLIDRPILTSCGIFEYRNPDGTVRRELRLPEHVFDEESLKSYNGKPVIITHNAGKVTKDNVKNEIVGTIISEGYRDGEDVKAQIVIHDVNKVKNCGMRELSLGYDLDLLEKPGIWCGKHYDAIQTNIRINHLAIVESARAGDQAHLNMDHKDTVFNDKKYLKGGKKDMSSGTRNDAMMTPTEFAASIEAYKAEKAKLNGAQAPNSAPDGTEPAAGLQQKALEKQDVKPKGTETPVAAPEAKPEDVPKEAVPIDGNATPKGLDEVLKLIADLSVDMQKLQETIDKIQAEKDITNCADGIATQAQQKDGVGNPVAEPKTQAEQVTQPNINNKEEKKQMEMKMDSIDAIVSQKLELGKVGQKLKLDGLETMDIMAAKKEVIKAVKPGMRLDDKSDAYIDAAYEMARDMALDMKTTNDQRQQMASGQRLDGMDNEVNGPTCSAYEKRQQLIQRRENRK